MAKCTHCSAPLPKSGIICEYCGTRNDIDLRDISFKSFSSEKTHTCPICKSYLETIDVGIKTPFYIERCRDCYGTFFDIYELDKMIENSVKGSRNVDLIKLAKISENPRYIDVVTYRKCPVCQETMQRKNFMKRSGVITDVCKEHGVWLDSGELRHIMEWVKTGGIEKIKEESKHSKREVNTKYAKAKISQESFNKKSSDFNLTEILETIFFSRVW